MKTICVFCGSSLGEDPTFIEAASKLGEALAKSQITLVYGGANIGLMGTVANAVLKNGGKVIGVIPKFLAGKEIAHPNLTELILVESMHERKMKMFELSEGFIAMPGGFGTLEELSEMLTWQQLGLHRYPIGLLNINGFYNHLQLFFEEMEKKKLLKLTDMKMALFNDNIPELLLSMENYQAPHVATLISKATS